jgi:hypothetical protein
MEFVVFSDGCGHIALGLVLGTVETGHDIVDGALELDVQLCLASVVDLLAKVQCNSLPLLVVCDVLCRTYFVASLQLSAVYLELMCVKYKLIEAIVLCDLGVDLDAALVAKFTAELDIVEGKGVVRWFGPECPLVSFFIPSLFAWLDDIKY